MISPFWNPNHILFSFNILIMEGCFLIGSLNYSNLIYEKGQMMKPMFDWLLYQFA